jgi:prepilin-type processing-associated H-X9-DG protein
LAFLKPLLDVESGSAVADIGNEGTVHVRLNLPDEASAKESAQALQTGIGVLRGILSNLPAEAKQDPLAASLLKQGETALEGVKVSQQQNSVQASAEFKAAPVLALFLPAVQKTREAASRVTSQNNLKQMALAMHNFHDTMGHLPPSAIVDKEGRALLSWRVAILPYIEQDNLYKQFHLDEPWDSEHNKKLLAQMPKLYAATGQKHPAEPFETFYQVFTGKGTMFEGTQGIKFTDVTDGLSYTLMIVEAADAVPWTKPDDLRYSPDKPLPKLGGQFPGGCNAAFGDGSVKFLSQSIDEKTLRALITRNGGENVSLP